MKRTLSLFVALLFISVSHPLFAQQVPLVYSEENTCADCPPPTLLERDELQEISYLPDPFEWSDGRGRIINKSDWRFRRNEISKEIQFYEIGVKPDAPENIEASFVNNTLTVTVTVDGKTLNLSSSINLPDGDGPHPVLIGMNFNPIPDSLSANRDIATMSFSHNQVTTYGSPSNSDAFYQLYPEYNTSNSGQYSAWAWGVSRLIDGLELVKDQANIDTEHIAVSGCSYAGKMAIFSGALDERIALTFGIESGGGGYTTWRYSEVINKIERVETLGSTDYNWFKDDMVQFANNVDKLPMDHHELMGMVAPRALFVTGNPGYTWLADESGYVGSLAAKEIYRALGVPERFGYSQIGGHNHCSIPAEQVPEIVSFLDKYMVGQTEVETNVATSPYTTDVTNWIPWQTPSLGDDTTFYAWSTLLTPEQNRDSVNSDEVTFTWTEVNHANKYIIRLSTDPNFESNTLSDSTDQTSITFSTLDKGQTYFWQIKAKNAEDEAGPWSNSSQFNTYIDPPATPILSTASLDTTIGYYLFTWQEAENGTLYDIEVSQDSLFQTSVLKSTATEAKRSLFWRRDGVSYWRVRATNIYGASNWSDVSTFTSIVPPLNLAVTTNNIVNGVALSWRDLSKIEEGFIIERKAETDDSFIEIGTVGANANSYIDYNVESTNYSYRVKAYLGEYYSSYSNTEAIGVTVGIEEDYESSTSYKLSQNYPNPFNPSTSFSYQLPQNSMVRLSVFDALGRELSVLVNQTQAAGTYTVNFDASGLASGTYLYRLVTPSGTISRKMLLLK